MIRVINKHKLIQAAESDAQVLTTIYIGRGSALGNPFPINAQCDRDFVCDEYELWFLHLINTGSELGDKMRGELNKIRSASKRGDVNLVCYCAPKRCHGDFIKEYIDRGN